jgi:hypothetical protein
VIFTGYSRGRLSQLVSAVSRPSALTPDFSMLSRSERALSSPPSNQLWRAANPAASRKHPADHKGTANGMRLRGFLVVRR